MLTKIPMGHPLCKFKTAYPYNPQRKVKNLSVSCIFSTLKVLGMYISSYHNLVSLEYALTYTPEAVAV